MECRYSIQLRTTLSAGYARSDESEIRSGNGLPLISSIKSAVVRFPSALSNIALTSSSEGSGRFLASSTIWRMYSSASGLLSSSSHFGLL